MCIVLLCLVMSHESLNPPRLLFTLSSLCLHVCLFPSFFSLFTLLSLPSFLFQILPLSSFPLSGSLCPSLSLHFWDSGKQLGGAACWHIKSLKPYTHIHLLKDKTDLCYMCSKGLDPGPLWFLVGDLRWVQVYWHCWSFSVVAIPLMSLNYPLNSSLRIPISIQCLVLGIYICFNKLLCKVSPRLLMLEKCL